MTDAMEDDDRSTSTPGLRGPWPSLPGGAKPNRNPDVLVGFSGLMGFCYNEKDGTCEVGFHCASPSHKLELSIEDKNGALVFGPAGFPDLTRLELGVMGKKAKQVYFYQASGDIVRTDYNFDEDDFRWLIDLEHRDFYNRPLPLVSGIFRKRLNVAHGNFFTIGHTKSTFDIVGGPKPQAAIHVARFVGVSIDLLASECVDITINGGSILDLPLCKDAGAPYVIKVENLCHKLGGSVCEDNDFFKNLDVVDVDLSDKFDLVLNTAKDAPGFGGKSDVSSDRAPCMGTGFGQGGGFPEFPPG